MIGILLWTNECALSSFMRRRMTILISSIALVIFLIDGRIFVRQISYEDSRQQSFNYIGKFGYACALKEGSEWWEYSLRTRMAACGLSFSGPKETDVVKLEILWPLVFAVDDIISNRDFLSIVGVKSRALNPIIRYKKNGSKNDE